jgi:hypothetical protein
LSRALNRIIIIEPNSTLGRQIETVNTGRHHDMVGPFRLGPLAPHPERGS